MLNSKMVWLVEYTNHPFLEKKRKELLETALADYTRDVESLLGTEENSGLVLGETGFNVESVWLPDFGKHHLGVRYAQRSDQWVATVVFTDRETMRVKEVKSYLGGLGLNDCDLTCLGVTNEKTVGKRLAELRENLMVTGWEDCRKQIGFPTAEVLEGWLGKGTIRLNDGLLDALKKIQNTA